MKTKQTKPNPRKILGYLMAFAMVFFTTHVSAQCTSNTSSYGSGIASATSTVTISTCNYLSEYSSISGVVAGVSYTTDIQMGGTSTGYVTIVEGDGTTHHGSAPMTWTANASGSVTAYWNVDASCATNSSCHVTSITGNVVAVPGCTDPLATNYNAAATVDDGSCTYPACMASTPYSEDFSSGTLPAGVCPGGWSISATSGDGWRFTGNPGYNASSSGLSGFAWIDFSSTDVGVVMQMEDIDVSALGSATMTFDYFSDPGTYALASANIMYVEAYDGAAWNILNTFDQFTSGVEMKIVDLTGADVAGIVTLRFRGESSGLSSDFYNDLLVDNISVDEAAGVYGCMDSTACNFNSLATASDGSCDYSCFGCTDSTAYNFSSVASIDDGSCLYGCSAGDIAITVPYAGVGLTNCGSNSVTSANASSGPLGSYYLNGDDATYSFTAASNDAYIVDLVTSTTYSVIFVYDACPTSGGVVVASSGSSASNESASFSGVAGTTYYIVIDTWPAPFCIPSYDLTVSIAVGGCTNTSACNYDSTATVDDGSCTLPGCTDPLAVNYDASAGCDDGSCLYSCTAAPYSENFDSGFGTWTTANTGSGSYTGWYLGTSTPSSGTGPQSGDVTGGQFVYIETSSTGGPYTLTSECLDISALASPALRFSYHMYGSSMGTLDVSVNGTSVWSLSGDQGNAWIQAQVDLSAYVGNDITVVFTGTRGTSFTGDMSLDAIEVNEMMSLGCTDSLACNYDPSATTDDGSCTFALAGFDCAGNCLNGGTSTTIQNREVGSFSNYSLTQYGGTWSLTDNASGQLIASDADGDDVTVCLPDGCYDLVGNSGSGPSYPWGYSLNGAPYVVPGAAGTSGGSTQFAVGAGVCAVYGCTDSTASNYNAAANTDDGSCTYPGCTDTLACNYDATANTDDGSCTYPGCTDSTASNYSASAGCDDGSCTYPPVASMCCNTSAYASAVASATSAVTVSTCNYLSEYSTISGVDASTSYTASISGPNANPGWITVYEGSSCGNWVAEGSSPLTFTSLGAGTYYIHWGVDNTCATATGCHTTTLTGNVVAVPGCTDTAATNYNPLATVDDGSCTYPSCLASAPYCEDFNAGSLPAGVCPGTWSISATSGDGWRFIGNPGYNASPSMGNNRAAGTFAWIDFSSTDVGVVMQMEDVDISGSTNPAMTFDYFSDVGTYVLPYPNTMFVEAYDGAAWNVIGTFDQFTSGWETKLVYLTGHDVGGVVTLRFRGESGSGGMTSSSDFYNDLLVDDVCLGDAPLAGCTDPIATNYNASATIDDGSCTYVMGCTDSTAANYNALATMDDGSCLYPGCMDAGAVNYNSSANADCAGVLGGTDMSCCTYPASNIHPFCEDVESQDFATNGWVVNNNDYASARIFNDTVPYTVNPAGTSNGPLAGAASILFDAEGSLGSSFTGWTQYTTEAQVYANVTHVASASIIVDMAAAGASCEMSFNAQLNSGFSNPNYSCLRVKVNGTVIADVNGTTMHAANVTTTNGSPSWAYGSSGGQAVTYNMSAYSGQSVTVTFEYAGKYGKSYSAGAYGCPAIIDDICFYDLSLCSYYAASGSSTDVTCNGGNDGTATVSSSNGSGMDMYMWSNGAATASISGLSAGTYTCIVMDDMWGCMDTVTVTVGEPSAMTLSGVVVDESAAGNDGSIDLSVSGGTPCITAVTLSSHNATLSQNGSSGCHFNIVNNSATDLTVTDIAQGSYTYSGANNISVHYMPAPFDQTTTTGWTTVANAVSTTIPTGGSFASPVYSAPIAITPVVIPAGATYGFYVGGSSTVSYATATAAGAVGSVVASDGNLSVTSGYGGTFGAGSFSPRSPLIEVYYGDPNASAYTYSWSTGDSTEDVSGLAGGTYSVTATDCAGCTSTASYTVASASVAGCTDSLACNYNSAATVDDGSCILPDGCTDSTAVNYNPSALCDDGSCIAAVYGCTDPTACNYYPGANVDDGSCEWTSCAGTCGAITGVNLTDVIHDRAQFNWDNMNSSSCVVDQIRIRYREVGTTAYSNKTMGAPVGNSAPCLNTSKLVLNLNASTQYEYDFKVWYQSGTVVNWHANGTFTTADVCVNATNVTATPNSSTQTNFCWTNPATHEFVRLKYRIDSAGTSFSNIGGFGVMAPDNCKVKNGLTPGTNYRVMWRTWCNATGGPYRSPVWDGPVQWTQPSSVRLEAGETIANLDVYPNPSRDVFNVTFTSEDVQDLEVRVINIVGEVLYTDNLEQFVGEYTKSIDLATYTKGVYFLEITTNNGVVNKKLILQ